MIYFLESDRIYLRGVELSDLTDKYIEWMNDSQINQFMETWHFPHTRENIAGYIKAHTDNRNEPFFAICAKDRDSWNNFNHVGNVKLGPINWVHRHADISLFIGEKSLWGKGYGTEAIKLITDYAFNKLGLHKVKSGIYSRNTGSIHAFEKAGFQIEAILRDHVFFDGEYISIYMMGKINE
jgi:[ribosomal protein S5]-alanine N-acetyltransferase